jgi:hypothetical protein
MEKEKLLNEFEEKFNKMKKELRFKTSLEDLDRSFFINDAILKEGFVSQNVSRQVCHRIVETFIAWNEYLHSLIMPNPQNILNMSESKIFSQDEKKEVMELMKKSMEISSRNSFIGLKRDSEEEGKYIDYAFYTWENDFKPKITDIMEKINKEWGKK